MFDPVASLVVAALLLVAIFVFTWRLSLRLDNFSFVDVAWSFAFGPIAVWYAVAGSGWEMRRWAIAVLVAGWSLRLGIHLWQRIAGHHPKEDPRYAVLRERWQGDLSGKFLKFFLAQGVLVWLLMLPVFLISLQAEPTFQPLEIIGLALWLVALIGEGISDAQLKRFKRANTDPNAVCKVGLWRYSRHPNYFFQSLLWWALFLMALPAPWGWSAVIAPLAVLFFLLKVTGIPLTEKLAVEKRGDIYRDYQRTTSAFVPWFPKD